MNTFYVITNYQKDPEFRTAGMIRTYLEKKGKKCYVQQSGKDRPAGQYKYTDARRIPGDVECVLVLGGDGTLLQAARDLVDCSLPLLGINMGTLGYLAEIEHTNIYPALDKLAADEFLIEPRMMIQGAAFRKNRQLLSDIALNDIVIKRNGKLRVLDFNIYVDGVFLTAYSADGIILSTPTGSTGYNLSVGGPIVAPQASLILLAAVAPHTLNSRPIVLPDNVEIVIEVSARHSTDTDGADAVFDGDTSVRLNSGDRIVISRSDCKVQMIKTKNTSFLEILREKMSS